MKSHAWVWNTFFLELFTNAMETWRTAFRYKFPLYSKIHFKCLLLLRLKKYIVVFHCQLILKTILPETFYWAVHLWISQFYSSILYGFPFIEHRTYNLLLGRNIYLLGYILISITDTHYYFFWDRSYCLQLRMNMHDRWIHTFNRMLSMNLDAYFFQSQRCVFCMKYLWLVLQ